jgi:hypothetical protein
VDNNERYVPDSKYGVPEITPEVVLAFKNLPKSTFDELYKLLHEQNPALAMWLQTEAEELKNIQQKKDFAAGVLSLYNLLRTDHEVKYLEEQITIVSVDVDEDQQPSIEQYDDQSTA